MGIFDKFKIGFKKSASALTSGIKEIIIKKEIDDEKHGKDSKSRKAFTIRLPHQPITEVEWARSLCKRWNWEHHVIEIDERHLVSSYLRMSKHIDEPNGDRSLLPTHLLAQVISPHTRVAIGGDGGDELFCGYNRYIQFAKILEANKNKRWGQLYWDNALRVGEPNAIAYANKFLGREEESREIRQSEILESQWSHDPLNFLRLLDIDTYLPIVLDKVDKTSMYYGLEIRSPLLDTKLSMAALTISTSRHIMNGETKTILKDILRKIFKKTANKDNKNAIKNINRPNCPNR